MYVVQYGKWNYQQIFSIFSIVFDCVHVCVCVKEKPKSFELGTKSTPQTMSSQ